MSRTALLLSISAVLATTAACRGDDDAGPDAGGSSGADAGVSFDMGTTPTDGGSTVVTGDCPMGQGAALTVCELKLDGNPRQPAFQDVVQLTDVIVTSPTFEISTSSTATQLSGFYVQDQQTTDTLKSAYSGIIIIYATAEVTTPPAMGDVLTINGTFGDFGQDGYDAQKQVRLVSFTVDSTGTVPTPIVLTPAEIATDGVNAAKYEGVLVEVQNVMTTAAEAMGRNGNSIFNSFVVTGGLVVRSTISRVSSSVGQAFTKVAGILRVGTYTYDAGIYSLNPRNNADLAVTTVSSGLVDLQDPASTSRPGICDQDGGPMARSGTCPAIELQNVVITGIASNDDLWVQDPSVTDGRFAGVKVYRPTLVGTATIGAVVNVAGVPVLYYDLLELVDATVTVTSTGAVISPVTVTAADIPGTVTVTNGEIVNPYEGVLVRLENASVTSACEDSSGDRGYWGVAGSVIIGNSMDYSYNGSAASGGTPTCGDGMRPGDMRTVGDTFTSITGIMDYSFSQFRLNPRGDADLVR